jgi:FKBP-type peptidyl-prolyl cis-trans isomerase
MIKRRTGRTLGVAAALTLALLACGSNAFGPTPRDAEFAASLGIDLDAMTETASGLFYVDEVVGTGPAAAAGDIATVAYTGWLPDAEEFDSSTGFTFQLGEPGIIDGFNEGVTGMQIGGVRTIVVPPSLGYGSEGRDPVPGDAVMVFELTLTALN